METIDKLKESLMNLELTDEDLEKIAGGQQSQEELKEEMLATIQSLIYLTPTALTQLKQTTFFNLYAIYFRVSSYKTSPNLFDEFIDACNKYGNINYTDCYVIK